MSATVDPKKIQNIISAPVVSTDSLSPEANLMRSAKLVEAQAAVDTQFDPVVERFCDGTGSGQVSKPLVGLTILLGIIAIHTFRERLGYK
jgi:hypothetical protein